MSQFPKLNKTTTEKSAKTIDDAIKSALEELGVGKDDVEVKILDEGKKGFLGLGAKDAVVRVSIKESVINARNAQAKKSEKKPAVKSEKPSAPKKPINLPPEKRSEKKAIVEKVVEKEVKKPVEMTEELKEAAKKVFATPEVRNPKKSEKPVRKHEPKPVKTEVKPSEPRKPKKISDIPSDQIATKFLTDIFAAMQLDVKVSASMEDDTLLVNLDGENMGIIIGKRGDTLDSLQYLTSLVVNQQCENYVKVTIDTENYREKRTEALLALSSRLAEKVAKTGKKFTLEPMNPYERRVIHSNLQDHESVTTFSIGTEPYRKVVIAPKDRKPYKKGGYRKNNNRKAENVNEASEITAEKKGSYTTTYKADFKPQQHKAEFENFEAYLEAHKND